MGQGKTKYDYKHPSFLILVLGSAGLGFGISRWTDGRMNTVGTIVLIVGAVLFLIGALWSSQRSKQSKLQDNS